MAKENYNRYLAFVETYPYEQPGWEGAITVCFSHAKQGWVMLWVSTTAYYQNLTISTSHAFDPYPALLKWLESIIHDKFPAELEIDEEGEIITLIVTAVENDLLDFKILDSYSDAPEAVIVFRCKIRKHQLIGEFVRKFELFLEEYYQQEEWFASSDLRALDLSTLKNYLSENKE